MSFFHIPLHMWPWIGRFSNLAGVVSFLIGVPTVIATYREAHRARREAEKAQASMVLTQDSIEFVLEDGTWINLVPLSGRYSLPLPGAICMLPGDGNGENGGVYRVVRLEYIYTEAPSTEQMPLQARLVKAVAHVQPALEELMLGNDFREVAGREN